MAHRILILLIVCTALSGCSKSVPPAEQTGSGDPVEVAPGVQVAGDRGALIGAVLSDAGLAIQGARISVLGTPHFTDSDGHGRFVIVDVEPGSHRVQFQADGFRVHEEAVDVAPAAATYVNATLRPVEGLLPSQRPHVHDLWRGREDVTLVDLDYDLTRRPGFRGGSATVYPVVYWPSVLLEPNTNQDGLPIPVPVQENGDPSIVFPGTGEIQVTFDWTVNEDTTKDRLALAYRGPNMDHTVTESAGPGTTWSIAINQTQVDGGHEEWTAWRFYIVYPDRVYDPTSWDPGLSMGSVHVVIKIVRGQDPPLEPPHEDHWGSNATLPLLSTEFSYGGYPTSDREVFEQSPDAIVPPGTQRLWVKLTWRFENAVVPLLGDEYELMWRTAAQNPFTTTWDEYHRGAAVDEGSDFKVYEIDVAADEADQYYATRSDWSFSPYRPGQAGEAYDYGAQNRDRVFTLEVVAHR